MDELIAALRGSLADDAVIAVDAIDPRYLGDWLLHDEAVRLGDSPRMPEFFDFARRGGGPKLGVSVAAVPMGRMRALTPVSLCDTPLSDQVVPAPRLGAVFPDRIIGRNSAQARGEATACSSAG